MARSFLESALVSTLPSFTSEWEAMRRAYPPEVRPPDADVLAAVRRHVVYLLSEGRVAETTRFLYALERLLAESDPVLEDLLERDVIAALAHECRGAGIDTRRIEPYLGRRARAAWERAGTQPKRSAP